MFSKIKLQHPSKKLIFITVTVLFLICIFIAAITNTKKSDESEKNGYKLPEYSYIYQSSDVKCKIIPSYPGSNSNVNYCSGNLNVKFAKSKSKSYKVTFTSVLYRNGAILSLDNLNNLKPDKTKLALTFFDKEEKQVKTITYVE